MNAINNLRIVKMGYKFSENLRVLSIMVIIATVLITFIQCKNINKFTVSKQKVGNLTLSTKIMQLDKIFAKDSIVKKLSGGTRENNYFKAEDEYLIYQREGGKHLLTIIPRKQLDSTSTLKSIQIFDSRYKTKSNIHIGATFQEVNANNKISRVETSFSSVILFIDSLNATLTIDKEQLGLKDFSTQKVSLEQIPDLAKIKSFIIWFK